MMDYIHRGFDGVPTEPRSSCFNQQTSKPVMNVNAVCVLTHIDKKVCLLLKWEENNATLSLL